MILIDDWYDACINDTPLFYWDNDHVTDISKESWIAWDSARKDYKVSHDCIWFKDLYINHKDCVKAKIKEMEGMIE